LHLLLESKSEKVVAFLETFIGVKKLTDNQILNRREQFAFHYILTASWGVAGLALATGAVGLLFPAHWQICG
jgi:hypothetical protein